MSVSISKQQLLERIPTKQYGRNLFVFGDIDSTNNLAMTLAETGAADGTVVWAEYQSKGKGRLGRTWVGNRGQNLMVSVVLRGIPAGRRSFLPYYVSEAVAGGIEKTVPVSVTTKWPNDLQIDGRKCCGILIEGAHGPEEPFAVAGIGMNVNQTSFPDDLSAVATSLKLASGEEIDRVVLFHAVIETLEALMDEVRNRSDKAVLDAWKDRCVTFGRALTVGDGAELVTGKAIGLSVDGGLIVETANGYQTVYAGDVTHTA